MKKTVFSVLVVFCLFATLVGCQNDIATNTQNTIIDDNIGKPVAPVFAAAMAPGAPGAPPVWAYSAKTGIGSSYEQYVDGAYRPNPVTGDVSKVWFSLSQGIVTETMFGLIHQAQIKDAQMLMVGPDFVDSEQYDMDSEISYLHTDDKGRPLSPAYKIVNTDKDGKYRIEKHVFTDPDQQTLLVRYSFSASQAGIRPVLTVNPHINNDGLNDKAWSKGGALYAGDAGTFMTVQSSRTFEQTSVGFVGKSDATTDSVDFKLDDQYTSTGDNTGNVSLTGVLAELPTDKSFTTDLAFGFGYSEQDANNAAKKTLATGYQSVLANYNGQGDAVGWQDYMASLSALSDMSAMATDGGKLAYSSALVLKVQEDKTHAGALIASLSNPWGDTVSAASGATGYKAVWPRDFYQCAMALLALGDTQTPKTAFEYFKKIQVNDQTPGNNGAGGWFLQKTHVDGELEWFAVQADQTGMPIMLGWKLWKASVLSDDEIKYWFTQMLKPAADFLTDGGTTNLGWNQREIRLPWTQQERWEEQEGYSPSTTAAVVAGLVAAADIASFSGDDASSSRYLAAADEYESNIERFMFTTTGKHNHNGQYYLRVTQNTDPNDNGPLLDRNGRGELQEKDVIDGGFLELVRYGLRAANDKHVIDTLEEYDDQTLAHPLRVKYEFSFAGDDQRYPGWRRYGLDGYGEDFKTGAGYGATGSNGGVGGGMSPDQRGRVWPFFTGERAHYELARGENIETLRNTYVKGLEYFANEGLMLPEQVFDGVGVNPNGMYQIGEGTNSATPLAWTHAEYVKLLRSLSDKKVWDHYSLVSERYQGNAQYQSNTR